MAYIHCTFTQVLTDGSALTHAPVRFLSTLRSLAVYPLEIHNTLVGTYALSEGPLHVVQQYGDMSDIHCAFFLLVRDDEHSLTGKYRSCQKYGTMPYINCTFTLLLTNELQSLTGQYP